MTKTYILKAEDSKDIEKIAMPFLDKGFKVISEDETHLIAKKRNFGSYFVHLIFILLILFVISYTSWMIYVVCGVYITYFLYFLFSKSEVVLITTETSDKDGNPVEFDNIGDIAIIK
ncbi:MAG: hypothetical protein FWH29_07180 [Methanobrevibacter sp.]|nr:hypothetical protein [Methanobrevibacter sp.]